LFGGKGNEKIKDSALRNHTCRNGFPPFGAASCRVERKTLEASYGPGQVHGKGLLFMNPLETGGLACKTPCSRMVAACLFSCVQERHFLFCIRKILFATLRSTSS
jgi:hypothetical protein